MMRSAPQSLYRLVGTPDAESGFWLLRPNYYRLQLRRDLFFRRYQIYTYGQIYQDETWAEGISVCDLIFIIYSYNKNKQNFRVLPLAPNIIK